MYQKRRSPKPNSRLRRVHIKRKRRKSIIFSMIIGGLIVCAGVIILNKIKSKDVVNKDVVQDIEIKDKINDNINKDTSKDIIPGSNINFSANDYAVDMHIAKEILDYKYPGNEKIVFLTFDDGPSYNTEKVLNVLNEKNVHGTFFVQGVMLEKPEAKNFVKRAIREGNAIANHTYSHSFKSLYPNNKIDVNTFMKEYEITNNKLKEILGNDFDSKVIRMPGGYMSRKHYKDESLPAFNEKLSNLDMVSIDWNALNGDAEGKPYTKDELINNTIATTRGQNQVVVLMHDAHGKDLTVEALPGIIDYFKNNGYEFKVIKST